MKKTNLKGKIDQYYDLDHCFQLITFNISFDEEIGLYKFHNN